MQTFVQLIQNEYIRLALAVGLVCVAAIVVWILLRSMKLWYWKTETVLDALDTISYRLETVEDKLGIANQDVLDISENVYAIGHISQESVALQEKTGAVTGEIVMEVKESRSVQEKMAAEIAQVRELLFVEPKHPMHMSMQEEYDQKPYDLEVMDDIDDLWLENEESDFPEDDEDEIRKKIRL